MSLSPEEYKQYSRHLLLDEIGEVGQLKLKNARVLVIGAGGLGCPILQFLAAAGVGTIGIVDNDTVSQSNLQRQVLFRHDDIGKFKVEVVASTLKKLNPYIRFELYKERLRVDNVLSYFDSYDIIVDGTDNFPSRYLINDAAVITKKPLVFGSVFKFEGHVSVFNYKGGPTYRCLFPTAPDAYTMPSCEEIGVLGVLPGIIGSMQANEVIKIICGIGEVLSGKLLSFDTLSMGQQIFRITKSDACEIQTLQKEYSSMCGLSDAIVEINWDVIQENKEAYDLLDVRTLEEREISNIGGLHIPILELKTRFHEITSSKKLVVYCKSGLRSKKAIQILKENGLKIALYNLKGGCF